jgi:hypothetical protein
MTQQDQPVPAEVLDTIHGIEHELGDQYGVGGASMSDQSATDNLNFDLQTRHTLDVQGGTRTLVLIAPDDPEELVNPNFQDPGWQVTVKYGDEARAQRFPGQRVSASQLWSDVLSALLDAVISAEIDQSQIQPWVERAHAAYQKRIGA